MKDTDFLNFGKTKAIIVTAVTDDGECGFHHNVLIENDTTFEQYYESIEDRLVTLYEDGYKIDVIPQFKVRVWNLDHVKNSNIKITRNATTKKVSNTLDKVRGLHTSAINNRTYKQEFISPLASKHHHKVGEIFATMDIETMELPKFGNIQIPVAISTAYKGGSKIFIIDSTILNSDDLHIIDKAVNVMWKDYMDFMLTKPNLFKYIFVHNLGSFDGLFLYKGLINIVNPDYVNTIIDDHNKFINITYSNGAISFEWKDSLRMYPVSLSNLCKVFGVKGKIGLYNLEYNNLNLFSNSVLLKEFKDYSLQDSIGLRNALIKAQELYLRDYNVDICKMYSTSTLSLRILRQKFLKVAIPILKRTQDAFTSHC